MEDDLRSIFSSFSSVVTLSLPWRKGNKNKHLSLLKF